MKLLSATLLLLLLLLFAPFAKAVADPLAQWDRTRNPTGEAFGIRGAWEKPLPSNADRVKGRGKDIGIMAAPLPVPPLSTAKSGRSSTSSVLVASLASTLTLIDTDLTAVDDERGEGEGKNRSAADGNCVVRWSFSTLSSLGALRGDPKLLGDIDDTSTTAAIVTSLTGYVAKINLKDGQILWKWRHSEKSKVFSPTIIPQLASHLVPKDMDLFSPVVAVGLQNNVIVFIDSRSGKAILSVPCGAGVWAPPLVLDQGGKVVFGVTANAYIERVDITPRREDSYSKTSNGEPEYNGVPPMTAPMIPESTTSLPVAGVGEAGEMEWTSTKGSKYSNLNATRRWKYDTMPNVAPGNWRVRQHNWIWPTPLAATLNQKETDLVIFGATDGKIRGVSLWSGQEKWTVSARYPVTTTGVWLHKERLFAYVTGAGGEVCFLGINRKNGKQTGSTCVALQGHSRCSRSASLVGDVQALDDRIAVVAGTCDGNGEIYFVATVDPAKLGQDSASGEATSGKQQPGGGGKNSKAVPSTQTYPILLVPPTQTLQYAMPIPTQPDLYANGKTCLPYVNFGLDTSKNMVYVGCTNGNTVALRWKEQSLLKLATEGAGDKKTTKRKSEPSRENEGDSEPKRESTLKSQLIEVPQQTGAPKVNQLNPPPPAALLAADTPVSELPLTHHSDANGILDGPTLTASLALLAMGVVIYVFCKPHKKK